MTMRANLSTNSSGFIRAGAFGAICLSLGLLSGGWAYAADDALHARAGADASIPLPETAEDVDFNGEDGKLEFTIAASVKAVAEFYRAAMAPLGWKETPSVINRPNMVELEFAKGDDKLSLNIMQMGKTVDVTGDGDGLKSGGEGDRGCGCRGAKRSRSRRDRRPACAQGPYQQRE